MAKGNIIFLLVYFILAAGMVIKLWKKIRQFHVTEEYFLLLVAGTGGMLLGRSAEAVLTMACFLLGKWVEQWILQRKEIPFDEGESENRSLWFALFAVLVMILPARVLPAHDIDLWMYRGLILFVLACPMSVAKGSALVHFCSRKAAEKQGICWRQDACLEALWEVDNFLVDPAWIQETGKDGKNVIEWLEAHNKEIICLGEDPEELLPEEEWEETVAFVGMAETAILNPTLWKKVDFRIVMEETGLLQETEIRLSYGEPRQLIRAMELSRKVGNVVKQNRVFDLGMKILFAVSALLGLVSMVDAILLVIGIMLINMLRSFWMLKDPE